MDEIFDLSNCRRYDYINITKVYDGDTVTVNINLGLNIWINGLSVRLYGIDTPEVRGEEKKEGIVSRDRLIELVTDKPMCLYTITKLNGEDIYDKYGRLLGVLVNKDDGTNYNRLLVEEGLADLYYVP